MGKDHTPGTFNRESGYESDLEKSEKNCKRVNTSFGSKNHNAYIHNKEGTHEHYWYNPSRLSCGYHGENFPTKNNHPIIENISENKNSVESDINIENIDIANDVENYVNIESTESIDITDGGIDF